MANVCTGNQRNGIQFTGDAAGSAQDNVCEENGNAGIAVSERAHPALRGNSCRRNAQVGIGYFGAGSGLARENTCEAHQRAGIYVGGAAQPLLERNGCRGNAGAGIAFFGESGGWAAGNVCEANARGIYVDERAGPLLEGNVCRDNHERDVVILGVTPVAPASPPAHAAPVGTAPAPAAAVPAGAVGGGVPDRPAGSETEGGAEREDLSWLADRPDLWEELGETELMEVFRSACARYGATHDASLIPGIKRLYQDAVCRQLEVDRRTALLGLVFEDVERGMGSVMSLTPFLFDPDPGVIASAGMLWAQVCPLEGGDAMTGPRRLLSMAESARHPSTRTGLVAAVLLLGDRRTQPLLHGYWRALDEDCVELLVGAQSGYVYASTVEFFLEWLEEAERNGDDTQLGMAAAALVRLRRTASMPLVLDVERRFPATAAGRGPKVRTVAQWSLDEFGALIAPRLRHVARREREPKVIPFVLQAWGQRE
jgi:hypothetical protein